MVKSDNLKMILGLKSRMKLLRDEHFFGNLSIAKWSSNTHFSTWMVTTSNVIRTLLLTVEDYLAETKQGNLRSDSNFQSSTSSGIFSHECLFCRIVWKSQGVFRAREKWGNCEAFQASDAILVAARTLNDSSVLSRISGIDMIGNKVKYHHSCRKTRL